MKKFNCSPAYYWQYFTEPSILVIAVGFGLGPRTAASNLLEELGVIESSNEAVWQNSNIHTPKHQNVTMLLNFGVLYSLPQTSATHKVWIDCVDWLRRSLPEAIQRYDLLLRESFFDSNEKLNKGSLNKWYDIKPLIKVPELDSRRDSEETVISFGGVHTPYSSALHTFEMPVVLLKAIRHCLLNNESKVITAFLPRDLLEKCQRIEELKHERFELHQVNEVQFKKKLATCHSLICQAGLYTPFEAMMLKTPISIVFPMSFTQVKQIQKYREMGINCCTLPIVELKQNENFADIELVEESWFRRTEEEWTKLSENDVLDSIYSFLKEGPSAPCTFQSQLDRIDKLVSARELISEIW